MNGSLSLATKLRRSPLAPFVGIYGAVVLQGWFLHRVDLSPDLVLLTVFAVALRSDEIPALALGAYGGLLVDVTRGGLLGPSAMGLGIVGFAASSAKRWFSRVEGMPSLVLVFSLSILAGFVEAVILQAFLEYPITGEWMILALVRSLTTTTFWVPGALLWSSESKPYDS